MTRSLVNSRIYNLYYYFDDGGVFAYYWNEEFLFTGAVSLDAQGRNSSSVVVEALSKTRKDYSENSPSSQIWIRKGLIHEELRSPVTRWRTTNGSPSSPVQTTAAARCLLSLASSLVADIPR